MQTYSDEQPPVKMQLVKLLVEIGPLGVFFLTNAKFGIFAATGAFMAATAASLIAGRLLFKKIAIMPLVTGVLVLVMGTLTLYLHDETFIKLKPTIVNVLFAGILLSGLLFGVSLLKYLFADVFRLQDEGWQKLTVRWAIFFALLAILNEVVWRNFSTDTWVSFKVFGIMPLTFLFSLMQIPLLQRYQVSPEPNRNLA